jgi:hypothetical protein
MGRTGLAGDRHLHFSLHQGVVTEEGVPPTVPIRELVTREFRRAAGFAVLEGRELVCSKTGAPWTGGLYVSENDGRPVILGAPSPKLDARAREAGVALDRATSCRERLWEFSQRGLPDSPLEVRRLLAPMLAQQPNDPVAHYVWAREVEMPAGNWEAADRHLALAQRLVAAPQLFEPWLPAWVENQRGVIAMRRHQPRAAEEHFRRALELHPMREAALFARARLGVTDGR